MILEYEDYAKEFVGVDVPTIQPQPVESTQGANRTPRATRTPNPTDITIKQQKPVSTTPPPPNDDQERDDNHEATLLILSLHKTAKIAEKQENMAAIQEKILEEDVEKIVEGEDEEYYASEFLDLVFLDEEDSGTRRDSGSHKKNPETIDDDDEEKKDDKKDDDDDGNDDHDDHALLRTQRTGSSEDRTEKMQKPIPSPPRSPRKDLSPDKAIAKELMISVTSTPTPTTSSQRHAKLISKKYPHIPGSLHKICRRQGFMTKKMEKQYVTNREFQGIKERVDDVLHDIVPKIASNATNDLIEDNLPRIIADAVKKEQEASQAIVLALISKEFADHVPKIIEELFKIHMKNNVINVHPITNQVADLELWDVLKRKFEKSSASTSSCRDDAFHKRGHDEHQGDDAPPEGEKRAKRQKTSKGSKSASGSSSKQPVQGSKTSASERQQQEGDAWVEDTVIDENEVIPKDETLELIEEFQNIDKRATTIYDHERMEATLRGMMSNQFRDAEEYAYHLE
ncbi:hypothetical protein Tco_0794672 [Tanacetum coccineum]